MQQHFLLRYIPASHSHDLCVALHTLLGHSFARLGRFDAARQHFMSVVKPYVMMAPTPDMHATILQTFNEIMDALRYTRIPHARLSLPS
jgi:hypothetical protein